MKNIFVGVFGGSYGVCFSSESKSITTVMTCFEWSPSEESGLFRARQDKQRETDVTAAVYFGEKRR